MLTKPPPGGIIILEKVYDTGVKEKNKKYTFFSILYSTYYKKLDYIFSFNKFISEVCCMKKRDIKKTIQSSIRVLIVALALFLFNINGIDVVNADIVKEGDVQNFGYTGNEQTFTAPFSGYYKLETWGAQGTAISGLAEFANFRGGYGGYSVGTMYFKKDDIIYINVGGQGSSEMNTSTYRYAGGYNGGGGGKTNLNLLKGDHLNGHLKIKKLIL